jgi:membrane-associated phospholipid phosphatase
VALFCYAFHTQMAPLPAIWTAIAITGTLLLTCVLPVTAILILIRRGKVSDLYIDNARQRTFPYLYTFLGFCFWCYLMTAILQAPLYIAFVCIGATAAISIVALINRKWKISAHLSGLGGLFGGMMTYCLGIGAMPTHTTIYLWAAVSLLLMYARLRLNAHTPAQVCAGWLVGIACTFIPYYIYSYVA